MPLLQPPITGDNQLDSWTYRLTQSINNGLLPGVGGGPVHGDTDASGSGGTGTQGNSIFYLYQRTIDEDIVPVVPDMVTYDFTNLDDVMVTANNGWTHEIPMETGDFYIWVTFRYISDLVDVITNPNSWDTPVLLSTPTISYEMSTFGFDFIRADQLTVEAGVLVTRYAGEVARDITASVTSDHVKWTKHSLGSMQPIADPWNAVTPYSRGERVTRALSLRNVANATYPGPTGLPIEFDYEYINTGATVGMDPADGTGWQFVEGSRIKNLDERWNVTEGWTSGANISVDNQEVITQTEFRAQLRDDIADVPRR